MYSLVQLREQPLPKAHVEGVRGVEAQHQAGHHSVQHPAHTQHAMLNSALPSASCEGGQACQGAKVAMPGTYVGDVGAAGA